MEHFQRKLKYYLQQKILLFGGIEYSIHFYGPKYLFKLLNDKRQFKKQANGDLSFPISKLNPCYFDATDNAGSISMHYFWQDLHVAQLIHRNNPAKHIDIGSRLEGFICNVASFREIEVYDIRPLETKINNVSFKQVDVMDINSIGINQFESASSLHALEHFGLGRYTDKICYNGFEIGFNNITKALKQNGKFYFSVPIGKQRVEFHAHRVFSLKYLLELISQNYNIDSFSYVDDENIFYPNSNYKDGLENNFNCRFGCGIFELTKK